MKNFDICKKNSTFAPNFNTKSMEREFILINIIGFDKPGVTSAVTEVLGKYDAFVQDIGQSNLHHQLNLSILIRVDNPAHVTL